MIHGGAFALMPEPRPASLAGTSKVVAPLVAGVVGLLILLFRRQGDRAAGRLRRLYFIAFAVSATIAALGALALAGNLLWILRLI